MIETWCVKTLRFAQGGKGGDDTTRPPVAIPLMNFSKDTLAFE